MNRWKMAAICIAFLSLLGPLSACYTPAGRTAGQVVDDGTITTKVKAKLLNNAIVSGFAISVQTFQGEVTLTGAVDSERIREEAEEIARNTAGVREVRNLIRIK
ncbi:MAG: BON domain-containing protein [Desulfatiglans sp.]|jgi:hyperosmotically inducible protein|nr:BON domain-containing protein [Thermodesulfobacteriota bacterium]MEE4353466.1 BON domain-containing protein [Desulfatiglans sp.]